MINKIYREKWTFQLLSFFLHHISLNGKWIGYTHICCQILSLLNPICLLRASFSFILSKEDHKWLNSFCFVCAHEFTEQIFSDKKDGHIIFVPPPPLIYFVFQDKSAKIGDPLVYNWPALINMPIGQFNIDFAFLKLKNSIRRVYVCACVLSARLCTYGIASSWSLKTDKTEIIWNDYEQTEEWSLSL